MTKRFGQTRNGRTVPLGITIRVAGGWHSYVLNSYGRAVAVFIPE